MTTGTTEKKKTTKPGDPTRMAISRVQKLLEPLDRDERVRVLRATGLAFGFDLTLTPSPETKAYFDNDNK